PLSLMLTLFPYTTLFRSRWLAAACLLPDGKTLVAGGATGGSIIGIKGAELFDSVGGSWIPTGSMTNERCGFTFTLLSNGKVLARSEEHTSELQSLRHLVC